MVPSLTGTDKNTINWHFIQSSKLIIIISNTTYNVKRVLNDEEALHANNPL
jgi:hypothetical protein